jgi:hypothetical protein
MPKKLRAKPMGVNAGVNQGNNDVAAIPGNLEYGLRGPDARKIGAKPIGMVPEEFRVRIMQR